MKKYLFLLLACGIVASSCKKERSKSNIPDGGDKPSTKQYAVNFTVGGASLGTAAVSGKLAVNDAATDTLKKYIRTIDYLVYDSTGTVVRKINQIASTTINYGVISDLLSPGTYTVVFIGNSTLNGGTDVLKDTFTFGDPVKKDLFYQNFTITVTNTPINQPVDLKRLAGQIQIVATDLVPANVDSVQIAIGGDYNHFDIKTGFGNRYPSSMNTTRISHKFTAAERGKVNFKMSTLYFNVKAPTSYWGQATVSIYRYPQSAFKAPIVIDKVTCEANKITILSGHMFDNFVYPAGFQISFDPVWIPITVAF